MGKYKILEHRADLKVEIGGRKREEIFQNALSFFVDYIEPHILPREGKK